MHFGKRTETATVRNNGADSAETSDLDKSWSTEQQSESNLYDPNPYRVEQRSARTRYFIPHAFIGQCQPSVSD